MKHLLLASGAFVILAGSAMADGVYPTMPVETMKSTSSEVADFTIAPSLSTLGLGVEGSFRFNDTFGARGVFAMSSFTYDGDISDEEAETEFETFGAGVMADYHPNGGNFRISGGLFKVDYSIESEVSDVDFDVVTSDVNFSVEQEWDISPAATIGWDIPIFDHGVFSTSFGAIGTGGFTVTATESTGTVGQGEIDDFLEDVNDWADKLVAVPYVSVGIGLTF